MVTRHRPLLGMVLILWVLAGCAHVSFPNSERVNRMNKEMLKSLLGNPDLVILDVRIEKSNQKIRGAVHEDPRAVNVWAEKYPADKTLVLFCS